MAIYTLVIGWWWHRQAPLGEVGATVARTLAAAVPAATAGWALSRQLMGSEPASTATALVTLVGGGLLTVAVYVGLLRLLGAPELSMLRRRREQVPEG
jgi:hypothetical protein